MLVKVFAAVVLIPVFVVVLAVVVMFSVMMLGNLLGHTVRIIGGPRGA